MITTQKKMKKILPPLGSCEGAEIMNALDDILENKIQTKNKAVDKRLKVYTSVLNEDAG